MKNYFIKNVPIQKKKKKIKAQEENHWIIAMFPTDHSQFESLTQT